MIFLKAVALKSSPAGSADFPLNLPLFLPGFHLNFHSPMTLLVGENGSGKSTLLEGLAVATKRVAAGAKDLGDDGSLPAARLLAANLHLSWAKKTTSGFFLRAEDFFGYSRRLNRMQHELDEEAERLSSEYRHQGRSDLALSLALGTIKGQAVQLKKQYEALEFRSHGESFLHFFSQRLSPEGLYLLDEPEAPLSPQNQLTFLALLHQAIKEGSQFIIATHSPILMAYPGAQIFDFDHLPAKEVSYDDLKHVNLMRRFLNNPSAYLQSLLRQ